MAGDPSIERRLGRRLGLIARGLGPNEKLAVIGVLAIPASLFLPWYRAPISGDLVQTGFGAFNFAVAALLLTGATALLLLTEVGDGYRPPRPFSVGGLLIAAGAWSALIVLFLMLDRPKLAFAGVEASYEIHYGSFVALGGAVAIGLAGVRRRRQEYSGRIAHADDDLDEVDLGEEEEDSG